MDRSNITVTMPVTEYERLHDIEISYNKIIKMFERANHDGKSAIMTEELKRTIEEIFC